MNRRVADYPEAMAGGNMLVSFASLGLGLSFVVFVHNFVVTWAWSSWPGSASSGSRATCTSHPPSNIFGTIFFTTKGIHATHVLTGLILLGIVYYLGRKPGRFGKGNYWGVEVSVKYWHFVDVAWVFIYPTLYLVK